VRYEFSQDDCSEKKFQFVPYLIGKSLIADGVKMCSGAGHEKMLHKESTAAITHKRPHPMIDSLESCVFRCKTIVGVKKRFEREI
jgi:hypothetical protein